jgi:hypothetical protein
MKIFRWRIEPLVFWWTLGISIAYLFLFGLIAWLVFQGILIWQAYVSGNFSYIDWKLSRYALIAIVYFTIGGLLRLVRFI